jgi:outer membrane protein assembly factor BamB
MLKTRPFHYKTYLRILADITLLTSTLTFAADWPQFLGPTRDGVAPGPKPGTKAELLWKQDAGHGFAGPVIWEGKLVLFERVKDRETIVALDVNTGQKVWTYDYDTKYQDDFGFDDGPRSAPTVAGGKIYTFGAEGMLTCITAATGKKIWNVDTRAKYGFRKGWFGAAGAPLVEGNLVILNVGGTNGAGIVAFDKETGKQAWTATQDEASYSSGTAATIGGERHALFLTRAGLVDLEPTSGKVRFQFPWRSRNDASVNAATPLVVDDQVFISSSYRTGAALLKVSGSKYDKLWSNDESMSNHYSTAVYKDGFLYGFHGRQENGQVLRCVEWKTGKVRWTEEDFGAGTVTLVGDELLILRENGELVWAPASSKALTIAARTPLLPGIVRAYPAYAAGIFCARNEKSLGCWRLR